MSASAVLPIAALAAEAAVRERITALPRKALPAGLASGGELGRRVEAFNWYPAGYAHATWIPASWSPALAVLPVPAGRASVRIGEALLVRWGLDARPCLDFDGIGSRLALLDPEPLARLVYLAGLARHAEEVSRVLERTRVAELRRLLGEEAYRFAMFRAPLLGGPLSTEAPPPPSPRSDMKTRALAAGIGMLAACLEGAPPGLLSRLALKFPRARRGLFVPPAGERPLAGYMRLFRKVLSKEVDPAWDSLLSAAA